MTTMIAVYLLLFPAILSAVVGLAPQVQQTQLQEAKLKVTQLESRLKEIIRTINGRDSYGEKHENQIVELDNKIKNLQSSLSNLKGDDEKIKGLEEEVQVLWGTLRKNNFDIHVLEEKAREAEDRLKMETLRVEKMADIVSELWIQIQQFEQALQLKEMRLNAQRQASPPRSIFLKFMNDLSGDYLSKAHDLLSSHLGRESASRSYTSQMLPWLKRLYSTMKESHHELQRFIKQEMERYKFTSRLANEEIVFFVASALIIFPILSAWMLLSSQLR